MSGEGRRLRLPGKITATTLRIAVALAGVSCGDDGGTDSGPADAAMVDAADGGRDAGDAAIDAGFDADPGFDAALTYFCVYDDSDGGVDGGPFDAAACGGTVMRPEDCPPGCVALAG